MVATLWPELNRAVRVGEPESSSRKEVAHSQLLIKGSSCVRVDEKRTSKKGWTAQIFAIDFAAVSGRKRNASVAKEEGTP